MQLRNHGIEVIAQFMQGFKVNSMVYDALNSTFFILVVFLKKDGDIAS